MSRKISFTNREIETIDSLLEVVIDTEYDSFKHEYDYDKKQFYYDDIKVLEGVRSKLNPNYKHRKELDLKL